MKKMGSLKEKVLKEIKSRPSAVFALNGREYDCPIELAISAIGGKWKILIIWNLLSSKRRYSEIKYLIPGITFKMLTQQLKELEKDGIILKTKKGKKPPLIVEYSLTSMGKKLKAPILSLRKWGLDFIVIH